MVFLLPTLKVEVKVYVSRNISQWALLQPLSAQSVKREEHSMSTKSSLAFKQEVGKGVTGPSQSLATDTGVPPTVLAAALKQVSLT